MKPELFNSGIILKIFKIVLVIVKQRTSNFEKFSWVSNTISRHQSEYSITGHMVWALCYMSNTYSHVIKWEIILFNFYYFNFAVMTA